jgi:hypothetical protein
VNRFLLGLLLGSSAALIAWVISSSHLWTAVIGLVVAVLVWFGEFLLDDLI